MKTTKKALSVLLAVIMIMSSMSVCFGINVFAVPGDATAAQYTALANALKKDPMNTNYTTYTIPDEQSSSSHTTTITDKTGYFTAAAAAWWAVFNAVWDAASTSGTTDSTIGIYRLSDSINSGILSQLQSGGYLTSTEITNLKVENFLKLMVCNIAPDHTVSSWSSPKGVTSTVTINLTVSSYLKTFSSVSDIPASFTTKAVYYVNNASGKSNRVSYRYYLYNAITASDMTQTLTTDSTTKTQFVNWENSLKSYQSYFDATDVTAMMAVSKDATTLTNAKTAINNTYNAVVTAYDKEMYTNFFSAYDVASTTKVIEDTIAFLAIEPTINEINDLYAVDYTRMNKEETLAHLTEFKEKYSAYTILSDSTKALVISTYGFQPDEIEKRIAEIEARYNAFCIIEEKAKIDTHVDSYVNWTIDDIDENKVTKADLLAYVTQITTDINTISGYPLDLVADICGEDYISNLQALKSHYYDLAVAAGYNEDYLARYEVFLRDVQPATAENLDDEAYLEGAKNYDNWHTKLKALINEMATVLGEENANKLYDEVNGMMLEYMATVYSVLNTKVETQINTAYDLWKAYTDAYGTSVNFTSVSQYNAMRTSVGLIDTDAYEFLQSAESIRISQDAIDKYNAIKDGFPAYEEFLSSFGFSQYQQTVIDDIVREDTIDDIARENADIDNDGIGEYKTTDTEIEAIITKLDALLNNDEVQELLGKLINKDKETGEWTGESFDLGGMLKDLIKGALFTDNMINTIVGMLYPLVVTEFIKVWANDLPKKNGDYDIEYLKDLYTIFKEADFAVYPDLLATKLDSSKYADNITILNAATTNFKAANSNQYYTTELNSSNKLVAKSTPWDEAVLKDEDGKWLLNWGVDEAREKMENGEMTETAFETFFYQAFDDAVEGLKPLLLALIGNKEWAPDEVDHIADTQYKVLITLDVEVGLQLGATANRGYANLLVPVYEALGLTSSEFKAPSVVEGYSVNTNAAADILKAILDPIFTFADNLAAQPLTTILNILPNVAYALITDMVPELLDMLKTSITYQAIPYVIGGNIDVSSFVDISGGADISVGTMLNLKENLGVDLSDGLNTLLSGFGLKIPNIDQGKLATMGTLGTISTQRADWIYTKPADGKAYHITANKADVLLFLLDYVLGSGLLGQFITVPEEEGLVKDLLTNLMNPANTDNVLAALVELLNAKVYNTLEEFSWFDGTIDGESVVGNSANEIYLNPQNDWNEDKAEYLYENLDAIVGSILTMAKLDLDKTTEEVDGSIGEAIGGAIDGLLSDKTLTSLAALLAKLDLNALLAGDSSEEEATEGEDEAATVAEGEEAEATAIDVNELIKNFLGIDLAAVAATYAPIAEALEADEEYVYDFGVDAGTTTFAAALANMLAPLGAVLDFILAGENLEITISNTQKVELIGYNGYNNAIIPLLEALGCTVTASADLGETTELEATLNTLIARIDALTEGDVIKNIIDILPGVFYFLTSNGVSTAVRNLLQPVYVILDTIRPIIDVDLNELLAGIEIGEEGAKQPLGLDLNNINIEFIFNLLAKLIDLDLSGLKDVIYDICNVIGVDYSDTAKSTLQTEWKKGAYSEDFDQADLLTVVLSFVLEWITIPENGAKLDEMLGTDGIVASIGKVFEDVKIEYGTPNWMYWFDGDEAAFEAYLANPYRINTLATIDWENIDGDWDLDVAQYFAENIGELVDNIIAMINKDKADAPQTLAALLNGLVYDNLGGYFTDETINDLIGMLQGVLANVDDVLLDIGYELLNVDLVGLKKYECTKEIDALDEFVDELAYVLDTYAAGLIDLLFFGDDLRLAKKSDETDTIVINGGFGYEKGLAMILEALGCTLPVENEETEEREITATAVLGSLVDRIEEILDDPVNEILDLLPNLVYFLNANGAGVAVDNLLAPVNALITKINALGLLKEEIDLNSLLTVEINGEKVEILKNLQLANVVEIVEGATGLPLDAAEAILVNFCTGKITKGTYSYKMEAAREDVITILLYVALELISDDAFAAKLDEMLGTDFIANIKKVFEPSDIEYDTPDWNYAAADNGTVDAMKYSITYPNNWNEETAEYVTELLLSEDFDELIAGLIEGGKYESISALLKDKVNIFTTKTLEDLIGLIKGFLGGVDAELLELGFILDVDLNGLMNHEVKADINDVKAFAAELSTILGKYAPGVVEWLLLGRDYKLLVKDADGIGAGLDGEAYITISGAEGYKKGLALLLEALGCENLPEANGETAAIIEGVLSSLAARIDEILNDPIVEVIDLLPNLFYFLNTNGVAAVIKNTTAALTALSDKINVFVDVNLDVASMVDLKALLKLPDDAKLSMNDLSMAAVLEAVGMLVGLDLTKVEDVLVGFALGKFDETYKTVSGDAEAKRMVYATEFDKQDLVTVVANLALITLADEANAEFLKGLVGEDVYAVIISVLAIEEGVDYVYAEWLDTDKANKDDRFSALGNSNYTYGPNYTEKEAQYIADNFGIFVDNVIKLVGIKIGDEYVNSLSQLLADLVGGGLYNSGNVIAVRDTLAGLLDGIATLEVNGVVVGGYIVEVLKKSLGVDITAVGATEVPEFTENKAQFIKYLADVLDPLGPILNWLLTGKEIAFFTDLDKTDFIRLPGAKGYQNGIVLLLEALDCEGIVDPAALDEDAKGADIVKAIVEPLLNRLDEILANPADEIFAILPNLVYFINSKGLDVVVKNTLNSVYTILNAIEPIAKVDLYAIVGDLLGVDNFDKAIVDFDLLIEVLLGKLEVAGFSFEGITGEDLAGLASGYLVSYESYADQNADGSKTAYKMVYGGEEAEADTVTAVLRLIIKFVTTENNQEAIVALLESIGMTAEGKKYVSAMIEFLATCINDTQLGMDSALYAIYYVYYGVDKGAAEAVKGKEDLSAQWVAKLEELNKNAGSEETKVGNLITDIFDIIFETDDKGENGVLDDSGVASNGFLVFFQKIANFFQEIVEFFRNLFSFGK